MNSTLIDFNTCKNSILVMFVIGFMVGYCVGASDGLHGVIRWFKLILGVYICVCNVYLFKY